MSQKYQTCGSWLMAHGSVAHVAQSLALAVPVCGIHESIVILEAQLVLTFVHPPPIGERNRTQLVLTLDRISEPLRQIRPFRLLSASILPSKHTSKTSSHFRRAFPASSTLKHHRRLCEQPSSYASQQTQQRQARCIAVHHDQGRRTKTTLSF